MPRSQKIFVNTTIMLVVVLSIKSRLLLFWILLLKISQNPFKTIFGLLILLSGEKQSLTIAAERQIDEAHELVSFIIYI